MFLRRKVKINVIFSTITFFICKEKKPFSEMKNAKPFWFKKYLQAKLALKIRFGFKTCKELALRFFILSLVKNFIRRQVGTELKL